MKKKLTMLLAVLCLLWALSVPALAAGEGYIRDEADLLTDLEEQALLTKIEEIADTYGCGVYIVTVYDYWQYGSSPYHAAVELYIQQMAFGGESDNGILLMLSMSERDYSIITYGSEAEAAFPDRDLTAIEERFLRSFRSNLWYDGFASYVMDCEDQWQDYVQAADATGLSRLVNEILDRAAYYPAELWLLVGGGSCAIALAACLIMRAGMRTAKKQTRAAAYIPAGGVHLRVKQDRFTHTTQQVIHRPKSGGSSGGGSIGGGGGFRGHSGKF